MYTRSRKAPKSTPKTRNQAQRKLKQVKPEDNRKEVLIPHSYFSFVWWGAFFCPLPSLSLSLSRSLPPALLLLLLTLVLFLKALPEKKRETKILENARNNFRKSLHPFGTLMLQHRLGLGAFGFRCTGGLRTDSGLRSPAAGRWICHKI